MHDNDKYILFKFASFCFPKETFLFIQIITLSISGNLQIVLCSFKIRAVHTKFLSIFTIKKNLFIINSEEKLGTVLLGLGERLKKFRMSEEMTQEEFAPICGVARFNLSGIENGKRSVTDLMLYNLTKYFPDFDANLSY